MPKTSSASRILFNRYLKNNIENAAGVKAYKSDLDVAMQLRALRESAELTQAQLADRIGTAASAISRLENADYEGHSLAMLRRVADALGKQVQISFTDIEPSKRVKPGKRSTSSRPRHRKRGSEVAAIAR